MPIREVPLDPYLFDAVGWNTPEREEDAVLADAIRAAIDDLPADVRDVVNAVFWERLSRREVSRQFAISRAEVERRIAVAGKALGSALESAGLLRASVVVGSLPAAGEPAGPSGIAA